MKLMVKVEPNVRVSLNVINPQGRKTIIFLHGWPANYELFEYQYNILPQKGYCCIGIDSRGFGNSDKPWSSYSYDRLADDIFEVIKHLNLDDVTLLGHSTAGAVAIRYMARHEGYGVSKLVLCAAAAPSLIARPNFPQGQNVEVVNNIIKTAYKDRPRMLRNFGNTFFYSKVSPPLSDWLFDMGLRAASFATIAIAKDWLVEELFDDLSKVYVPTLIMHGIHDRVCPFPLAEAQKEGIRYSTLIKFKNSGHGLFYDEMDKFNIELAKFVD